MRALLVAVGVLLSSPTMALAEFEVSLYGGVQNAFSSDVTVTGANPESFTADWEGRSFTPPVYWGARGTYWLPPYPDWGVAFEYTHAKVYADPGTFARTDGWTHFEFTDGLNIFTVNALRRFDQWKNFKPYAGLGAGISLPHVEVTRPEGTTFEYQYGGPAFQALIGVDYRINKWASVFTEYKFNYTINDVELVDGDRLSTNIMTNAVVLGLSVHF